MELYKTPSCKVYGVKGNFELHLKECEWHCNKTLSNLIHELKKLINNKPDGLEPKEIKEAFFTANRPRRKRKTSKAIDHFFEINNLIGIARGLYI